MKTKEIDGVKYMKTLIPCPDGIEGCLVAHYGWVPVESDKRDVILFTGEVGSFYDDNGAEWHEIVDKNYVTYDSDDFEYSLSNFKGKKVELVLRVVEEEVK